MRIRFTVKLPSNMSHMNEIMQMCHKTSIHPFYMAFALMRVMGELQPIPPDLVRAGLVTSSKVNDLHSQSHQARREHATSTDEHLSRDSNL